MQLARAQVVAADENLMRARESLGFALGYPEDWGVTENLKLDALTTDARTSCIQVRDVETRTDVRAAATDVRLAQRGAGSAERSWWPTIDALSDLTYYPRAEASPTALNFSWTVAHSSIGCFTTAASATARRRVRSEYSHRASALDGRTKQARLEVTQTQRAVKVAEASLAVSSRTREVSPRPTAWPALRS